MATMLMRRLLDRYASDDETNDISDGLYGKKVFAFADDLDVINRMFHNLRDAEGQSSDGSPDYARATLRWIISISEEKKREREEKGGGATQDTCSK